VGHGVHCVTERPCTRVKNQQVLAFRGVGLKFAFDAHRIIDYTSAHLYACLLPFRFFLVLETTCIYFSFLAFRYRYCIIYFHGSAHKNFSNIIPNRHINCLILWIADKNYKFYHVCYTFRMLASSRNADGPDIMPTFVFSDFSFVVPTQRVKQTARKRNGDSVIF